MYTRHEAVFVTALAQLVNVYTVSMFYFTRRSASSSTSSTATCSSWLSSSWLSSLLGSKRHVAATATVEEDVGIGRGDSGGVNT